MAIKICVAGRFPALGSGNGPNPKTRHRTGKRETQFKVAQTCERLSNTNIRHVCFPFTGENFLVPSTMANNTGSMTVNSRSALCLFGTLEKDVQGDLLVQCFGKGVSGCLEPLPCLPNATGTTTPPAQVRLAAQHR